MYKLFYTNQFRKDVKQLQKRGMDMDLLKFAITTLELQGNLSRTMNPHKLSGNCKGYWEAHLKGDWLLLWKHIESKKEIWLTRTGTHSDLFK
jgi:mRNA interferase YafQ